MRGTGKKKRFMASVMALALMTAMPGGMGSIARVHAEEASGSSTEKVQLDKPTAWFGTDMGKYTIKYGGRNESVNSEYMTYWNIEVYKDEQLFKSGTWLENYYESYWDNDKQQWVYTDTPATEFGIGAWLEFRIFESGTYKFRAQAKAADGDETYRDSEWSEWSESISYVRPEQELGVVAKATWDEEKAGMCHFIPLSDSTNLHHYAIQIYTIFPWSGGAYQEAGSAWVYAYDCQNLAVVDVDLSDIISRYGEGQYYVTVQAFSNDIDTVANGRVSEPSEILDTTMNAEKLSDLLNSAAGKTAVETTELLTGSADISSIQQAMQTDDTFRGQMQGLESRYAQEQGIDVEAPAVSETAKEYVDPGQVSVVGAAFNAAQGKAVNLQIDVTPEEEKVPVFSGFRKNVQLDIKLVSDNAEVHELDVPVSVTMPIPQGINAAQLVLLHCRADGVTERISFHVNGDGTITFTVTSFSTFVFAEESSGDEPEPGEPEPGEPEPGDPEPVNPAPNPGQCDSDSDWLAPLNSQIAAAAPGAIVVLTKEQNIDTLSREIMQLLVKRGDVSLEMEYTYQGADYHILIPAGKAIDNDIPWYGPLYLAAHFSDIGTVSDTAGTYVVQKGDTLSRIARDHHTTVARLAAANPQIRNVNRIMTGQVINIK